LPQVLKLKEEIKSLKDERQELTTMVAGCCTLIKHGDQFVAQDWYQCYTCGLVEDEGMCKACVQNCH